MTLHGTFVNGVVVLDTRPPLPDGTRVEVIVSPNVRAASPLGERLLRHAGKAIGLPEDMAEQHDHYLYGTAKR